MAGFKDADFLERRTAATKAKKAALEKFRATTAANEPHFAERQAGLQATRVARDTRAADRMVARAARDADIAVQATRAREVSAQADRDAAAQKERDRAEHAERETALQADRKKARDARYAARKARQK
jgi:uncharacterized protein DUF6481